MLNFRLEKYNKDKEYSYTFGAFPTFELVKNRTKQVHAVLVHSKLKVSEDIQKLFELCKEQGIEVLQDDKTISRVTDKENCFVVGVFKKYDCKSTQNNRVVLVNPSDMGNMGTIMRTMLGFGVNELIVVRPCVDVFNPKVVRASMGALFSLNIVEVDSVQDYLKMSKNKKYFFMLNGKQTLGEFLPTKYKFDLVFGNEASGLPDELLDEDESVVIRHSKNIDSLNLPISVGIALYEFSKK